MLIDELVQMLGEKAVLTEPAEICAFTEDWRGRYAAPALCVALPANTEQVAETVRRCRAHGVPIVPQGGNTSLCGGAVPDATRQPPVIVNLSRMRAIRAVDPVNNTIEIEAGAVLAAVQEAAAEAGRLYPVSLGAEGSCQIGGTIATNAGGTGVLRYGNTRDNVLGLEMVLPDGSVWDGLYALRKNNSGYDLKHLFIGSEGTLGIITAAVLKLHPLPSAQACAWMALDTPRAALEVLGLLQETCGSQLSAFELINEHQFDLVIKQLPDRRAPVADRRGWHVLVELADAGEDAILAAALQGMLELAFERGLIRDAAVAASAAQRAEFWRLRHSVSEANKKAGVGLTTDCAVPVSAVPLFIEKATAAVRAIVPDLPVAVVAHLGDGNVHFIPFFGFAEWQALTDSDAIAGAIRYAVNDVAHGLGGTFSAEHGVGQTHLDDMARYKPPVELSLMRTIKHALDPAGLFNPGRLLPPAGDDPASGSTGFSASPNRHRKGELS